MYPVLFHLVYSYCCAVITTIHLQNFFMFPNCYSVPTNYKLTPILPVFLPLKVKVVQSCSTLCSPMDYRVHGILQARILEWVAVPFSRGSSQPRDRTWVTCIAGRSLPTEPPRKPFPTSGKYHSIGIPWRYCRSPQFQITTIKQISQSQSHEFFIFSMHIQVIIYTIE